MDSVEYGLGSALRMMEKHGASSRELWDSIVISRAEDESVAERYARKLSTEQLVQLLDLAYMYPFTDHGWSLLPPKHPSTEGLTLDERGDEQRMACQEDRNLVEVWRRVARRLLENPVPANDDPLQPLG